MDEKGMLLNYFNIFNRSMIQGVNNVMKVYDTMNLTFKSKYPTAKFPTIELSLCHWKNELSLTRFC